MKTWIPEAIMKWPEFLSEPLKELRDYVIEKREECFCIISLDLHIYEERVLFSLELDKKLPWSVICTYEDDHNPYKFEYYKEDLLIVKKHFLRGWLEDMIWDRDSRVQYECQLPDRLEDIGLGSEEKGYFFRDESIGFSIDSLRKYRDKYRNTPFKKRKKRPRYYDPKKSMTKSDNYWYVYITQDLWCYYYDRKPDIIYNGDIPFVGLMSSIRCPKSNETELTVIANYISWQELLREYKPNKSGERMKRRNNCLKEIRQLHDAAVADTAIIPDDMNELIKQISGEKRISKLSGDDQNKIGEWIEKSPKVRLAIRKAQFKYIRKMTNKVYEKRISGGWVKDLAEGFNVWFTPLWMPLPATASEREFTRSNLFKIEEIGTIKISIKIGPTYLIVSWWRDTVVIGDLSVNFSARERMAGYLPLGASTHGERLFCFDELKLDPSKNNLDISIKFELEKA